MKAAEHSSAAVHNLSGLRITSAKMARKNFDGVIESVRYSPEGQVAVVRLFEKRGPTYSDWVLLTRAELVERLKAGKRFVIGERVNLMASTFNLTSAVRLAGAPGKQVLTTSQSTAGERDNLQGVPLF
jgi:hypothetical protein